MVVLLHREVRDVPGPGVVAEEDPNLVVSVHVRRLECSRTRGEGEAGDEEGDDEGIDKSVLLEKPAQPLVSPHPEDVGPVGEHVQSPTQPADDTDEDEDDDLLGVVGELHGEPGGEVGHDCLLVVKPDTEHGKGGGADDGSKEASPVVPDGKVDTGDLNTEENSPDGTGKTAGHTNSHCCRQHFRIARLVGVNPLEGGDEFSKQGGHYAGNVDERPLLSQRHPGAESGGQPNYLGHERPG